jgi:hypothetical protein
MSTSAIWQVRRLGERACPTSSALPLYQPASLRPTHLLHAPMLPRSWTALLLGLPNGKRAGQGVQGGRWLARLQPRCSPQLGGCPCACCRRDWGGVRGAARRRAARRRPDGAGGRDCALSHVAQRGWGLSFGGGRGECAAVTVGKSLATAPCLQDWHASPLSPWPPLLRPPLACAIRARGRGPAAGGGAHLRPGGARRRQECGPHLPLPARWAGASMGRADTGC